MSVSAPTDHLGRRGALKVLGGGGASILLAPVLPHQPIEPPAADRFAFPLQGTVYVGYSHLDPVKDRSGRPTGEHHIGIDLNLGKGDDDLGAPARLIANGQCTAVMDVPSMCGLGRLAIFEHRLTDGSSVYSRFAHLESLQVHPGEIYPLGAVVGIIGRSGCQRSAHLHLDLATRAMWQRTLRERPWFYPTNAPPFWIDRFFLDPQAFIEAKRTPARRPTFSASAQSREIPH